MYHAKLKIEFHEEKLKIEAQHWISTFVEVKITPMYPPERESLKIQMGWLWRDLGNFSKHPDGK